ncbi:MAG: hypothetical protein AAFO87_05105 [Cyanobacteria bacterium J06607_6]
MGSMKERSPEHYRVLSKGLSPDVSPGDGAAMVLAFPSRPARRSWCP